MPNTSSYISVNGSIGTIVVNKYRDKLGNIEDFVVNTDAGRIEYVNVLLHAKDDITSKLISVPWSQFNIIDSDRVFELNVSLKTLDIVGIPRSIN